MFLWGRRAAWEDAVAGPKPWKPENSLHLCGDRGSSGHPEHGRRVLGRLGKDVMLWDLVQWNNQARIVFRKITLEVAQEINGNA